MDATTSEVVTITHADATLSGPVIFRYPTAFDQIAIGARVSDLLNAGRDVQLPRVHPADVMLDTYRLAHAVATLEHVIHTAPRGLYESVNGRAVLNVGRLVDEDDDQGGLIMTLYAAYEQWRSSFRRARSAAPPDAGA